MKHCPKQQKWSNIEHEGKKPFNIRGKTMNVEKNAKIFTKLAEHSLQIFLETQVQVSHQILLAWKQHFPA